jgi:adenylylsulfate kinase-like enzyme
VLVDGDAVRRAFGDDLGHDERSRRENADRIRRLCGELSRQGLDVVAAVLALHQATRDRNRAELERYFEVYVDVPLDELVARDDKGLYGAAREGRARDVVGIDIAFDPPRTADLTVRNTFEPGSAERIAGRILEALASRYPDALG